MPYLRTQLATDWDVDKSLPTKVLETFLSFVPKVNPGYEGKMHLLDHWLIEFDDEGSPQREVGLSTDGKILLAGPSEKDYGFWLDTNMKIDDFEGEIVPKEEFEDAWLNSGVLKDT